MSSRRFRAGSPVGLFALRGPNSGAHPGSEATACGTGPETTAGPGQGGTEANPTANAKDDPQTVAEFRISLPAQAGVSGPSFEWQCGTGPAVGAPGESESAPIDAEGHRRTEAQAPEALKLPQHSGRSDTGPGRRTLPAGLFDIPD